GEGGTMSAVPRGLGVGGGISGRGSGGAVRGVADAVAVRTAAFTALDHMDCTHSRTAGPG
ncbi:MAG TPA: hypothetical protein VFV33_24740, partial [Gemmatimonadaceae bacterium]|nr:hypothetical protein [Gemmatimonadaceae bacterium]